ncbi:MAG: YqgE/AlgH family protein [Gammaproteobacteria bacterium]|nr:YqgE/AlgH family protein [Gammaproteobacteria bacterium]
MCKSSLANHFLLALPSQNNTYFEDTLTYMVRHGDDGSMGFVVNRPLPLKLAEIMKEAKLDPTRGKQVSILEGGPVNPSHPSILHSDDFETDSSLHVSDGVALITDSSGEGIYNTMRAIAEGNGPEHFLFVLGYAGWGPKQLDNELGENAWVICPADHRTLFDEPFESRIAKVTSAIGIDFSKFSPQSGSA